MQKDQLGDFGLPDVCLTVALHDGLHYNTIQYCFVNIFLSDRYMVRCVEDGRRQSARLHDASMI